MALEYRHDFMNNPYVEGDVNGMHVIGEPGRDLITGQEYWEFDVQGNEYIAEPGVDLLTGEEYVNIENVGSSRSSNSRDGSAVGGVIIALLLIPLAMYLSLLIWKLVFSEDIPALIAVVIGTVGFTAYGILKDRAEFGDAFGSAIACISILFFVVAGILSFVIPVPGMATSFSIINLLGLGLISFLISLAPALIIAIASAILNRFRR